MTNNTSRAWSWRHAVVASDISGDCKHLLLTLSLYMNEVGSSCFPTIETLMANTGRGKTWVHKYLNEAIDKRWIEKTSVARKSTSKDNRGWRRNEYVATWPEENLTTEPYNFTSSSDEKGSSPDEPPLKKGSSRKVNGSSPKAKKVVREANTNIPKNIPNNIPSSSAVDLLHKPEAKTSKEEERINWDEKFYEIVKAHPGASHLPTGSWKSAFYDLDEASRLQAYECHSTWVDLLRKNGRKFFPSLTEYFSEKLFLGLKHSAEIPKQIELKPFGKEWLSHRFWRLAQGPTRTWKPTSLQQKMIDDGKEYALLRDRHRAEFHLVTDLDNDADNGRKRLLSNPGHRLSGTPERVERDSELWSEWVEFHERMGWPWLELPKGFNHIIMPISLHELDHTDIIKQAGSA